MLAAYQARVHHEIGDQITRQLHRVIMKYGKRALTREDGSYHRGVSVGTQKDDSAFVYQAVKKKNKDLFFLGKGTVGIEEISAEEMNSYATQEQQNKFFEKLFKRHGTEFRRCGYCSLKFWRKDNCKRHQSIPGDRSPIVRLSRLQS